MDAKEWDPMSEDFNSVSFNSYNHGAGANLAMENLLQNQNSNTKQAVSLYIIGLPLSISNDSLKNLFTPFGKVLRAYCNSKPPNQYKFGFVDFGTTKEALEALSEMNNKNIDGGTLKITFAKKSADKLEQHKKEQVEIKSSLRNPKMNGFSSSIRSTSSNESFNNDYQKINLTVVVPNDHSTPVNGIHSPQNNYKHEYYVGVNKLPQRDINMDNAACTDLGLHLSHLANGNTDGNTPVFKGKPRPCRRCQALAFFRCGNCRVVWYCGQTCQIESWPKHRIECDKDRSNNTNDVVKVSDVLCETTPPSLSRKREIDVPPNDAPKKFFNHNLFKETAQTVEPLRKPKLLEMKITKQNGTKPQPEKLLRSPENIPTSDLRGVSSISSKDKSLPLSVLQTRKLQVGENFQLGVVWKMESPDEVWFSVVDEDILLKVKALEENLNSSAIAKKMPKMRAGDIIAAQALDQSWYRAIVLEVQDFSAKVFFIDYGNEEVVNVFSELTSKHLDVPSVLLKAKVQSVDENLKKLQNINTVIVGKLLFSNDNEALFEWLDDQNESAPFGQLLCHNWRQELSSVVGIGDSQEICFESALGSQFEPLRTVSVEDNQADVYVIWVVNSKNIFIQKKSEELDLLALMKKLDEYSKNRKNARKTLPKEGNYVCARYSDKQWYRARVCNVDEDLKTVSVYLLDYGNTETVSVEEILPLPSEFLLQAPLAYRVALDGISVLNHDCAALLIDQLWKIEISPQTEAFAVVRFVNQKMCFNDYVKEKSKPKSIPKAPSPKGSVDIVKNTIPKNSETTGDFILLEDIPKTILEVGSRGMLLVNQFESPNSFFCTDLDPKYLNMFLKLTEEIEIFCKSTRSIPGFQPIKGQVVLAKFSEDNCWYRAVVMKEAADQQALVFFIDYGNFETVSYASMLNLPADFSTVKAQSVCVSLHGVIQQKKWGSDILKEFKEVLAKKENQIECEVVKFDEELELYEISVPSLNDFLKSKNLISDSSKDDELAEMLAQIELLKAKVAKHRKE